MLPALIVGGLTAWYLGLRAGIIAAAVTAAALLVAAVVPVPGITLVVYALVIAWSAAVYFLGSRITERTTQKPGASSWLDGVAGTATSWARKIMKKN